MNASRMPCRPWFLVFAVLSAVGLAADWATSGETRDLELYVSAVAPKASEGAGAFSSLEAVAKTINELDADGLLLIVSDPAQPMGPAVAAICKTIPQTSTRLWIAIRFEPSQGATFARAVAHLPVAGLALLFSASDAEPVDKADLATLLERKRAGDSLCASIRRLRQTLSEKQRLAVCVPSTEILPETSRRQYVPLGDLVRDGTVDTVCLGGAETFNLHRLRLLRDSPLQAGFLVDAEDAEQGAWQSLIARQTLSANENSTCDSLWLVGFPAELALRRASEAMAGHKLALERRQALEASVASGCLVVDQEVSGEDCTDQATVHGVAQRFVPTRDGACRLVQVYAAIRGCRGPLPPPLTVEIRPDSGGHPAGEVLATAEVSPFELGHEPDYRWAAANFESPLLLKQGVPYWIYLPRATHEQGSYVWRIRKDAGIPACHAWSRRFDYAAHTWAFRVYLEKESSL